MTVRQAGPVPEAGARTLRLGTRRSTMATTQSGLVAEELTRRTGRPVELVGVTTRGDTDPAHLASIGGTGVFVSALRDRLLRGEVDFAVHSLKDLPTADPDGIVLAAVPPRDDPRDVLITSDGRKLADLPAGAVIGTGAPRRVAQLRHLRPDLEYVPIRGNADTRIGRVTSGSLTGVVLAYAGLARLGRLGEVSEVFEADQVLPAPGQGALAVECRAADSGIAQLLHTLDDPATRVAVRAERAVLATLEAGCSAPVGAHATVAERTVHLTAAVIAPSGAAVRMSTSGPSDEPAGVGRALAERMLAHGAARLMREPEA